MKFGKSLVGEYQQGTQREYLVTNGLGSFSSGSINGNQARLYHGLLVSSFVPPLDRYMTLHKVEETLNGQNLATYRTLQADQETRGEGFRFLDSFEITPFPTWIYGVNGVMLQKELFMPFEREMVVVKYTVLSSVNAVNSLNGDLFFNYRPFDKMTVEARLEDFQYRITAKKNGIQVEFDAERPPMSISSSGQCYLTETQKEIEEDFYGNAVEEILRTHIAYDIELSERGDTGLDTSLKIASIEMKLAEGETGWFVASMEPGELINVGELYEQEVQRVQALKDAVSTSDSWMRDLAQAADTCIVSRKSTGGKTILAGYPWFGDWGRDTMIALPGLTLSTGRFEDARSILKTFAIYCDQGMLPNKFPDWEGETLRYNTIDASLWYVYAIFKYLEYTGDDEFIREHIYPTLKKIIDWHIRGTRYGIRVDEDGLITGGDADTQLTWMDVKYKGWAVTPRYGKAVEINALWYNALCVMENVARQFGDDTSLYREYAKKVEAHFEATFWNEKGGCLYDYVADGVKHTEIRPNQIFAVSLPYTLLSEEKNKQIVDTVLEKLYTPHGLRSLSADHEQYTGRYFGTLYQRDACYHQGTVWGWLMGHFITAYLKVYPDKDRARLLLQGLKSHFYQEGCIHNFSEIFDGDAPHAARGCFAQAWSVGEVLRVLKESF